MIEESFLCCHGVGPILESKIREAGVRNWSALLERDDVPIRSELLRSIQSELKLCQDALDNRDLVFLVDKFPTKEHWRILSQYLDTCSYFDIETTGLSPRDSKITVIVCWHRGQMYQFVNGENLDDFLDLLDDISLLVSFNGRSFDVPRVLDYFHIPDLPCAHIDLRWVSFHYGHTGGLKSIQKQLGFLRNDDLSLLSGEDAVYLWEDWLRGDLLAKERLIAYCQEDVAALKLIAEKILM